jgi:hypothetical protein
MIPAVQTSQIYKGSIAFICLQIVMVAAVIVFPALVTGGIEKAVQIDADKALESMTESSNAARDSGSGAASAVPTMPGAPAASGAAGGSEREDPMKGLLESMKADEGKKP